VSKPLGLEQRIHQIEEQQQHNESAYQVFDVHIHNLLSFRARGETGSLLMNKKHQRPNPRRFGCRGFQLHTFAEAHVPKRNGKERDNQRDDQHV
jgi:hypothetical protein